MSKRSFTANFWLKQNPNETMLKGSVAPSRGLSYSSDSSAKKEDPFDFLPPIPEEKPGFKPSQYFIPGWVGSSIFSKQALSVKKLQEKLWEDALLRLRKIENLPHSLAHAIHQEFLCSRNKLGINKSQKTEALENMQVFWKELRAENSPFKKELDAFRELYCFRVATNYLLRLKFLITFSRACNFTYSRSHIINPSTFSQQLFKKGSSKEISCEAFKINQYSWYQPTSSLATELEKLTRNIHKLSITQLMKLCSFRSFNKSKHSLNFDDRSYSHALSHRAFGQFVNQLMVFFPLWQKQENFNYPLPHKVDNPEILNTRFVGDHMESLGQSHWLAQEANMSFKWSEILCPEFASNSASSETFIKLGQELQFLTFLVNYAQKQGLDARSLVKRVTEEKYRKSFHRKQSQFNLFNQKELAYDRIILNVGRLPKKNPHHFLLQKIQEQKDILFENGILVVLSNQKLFVPSQSKKLEVLLKDFKVEATFNFEKLKAKGEITNFVYILSKRDPFKRNSSPFQLDPMSLTKQRKEEGESCFTFRVSGELTQFVRFEGLVKELFEFFKSRSSFTVSMLHKPIDPLLNLEFHQDAIIEGKLLSSLSKNKENITHPQFFKNLTRRCVPLEKFFNLTEASQCSRGQVTNNFLGVSSSYGQGKYLLIVDLRDSLQPLLEVCSADSYASKKQEYGEAYFHYYYMTPKISHLNLNLLREYFDSPLGIQIIQMCLSGGAAKLKGKIRALLVPQFFGEGHDLNGSDFEKSPFLTLNKENLRLMKPADITQMVKGEIERLKTFHELNPWAYLSLLSHAKVIFKGILETEGSTEKSQKAFQNPVIKEELVKLETVSVYPNEEVFTELLIENKQDLERPLTRMTLKSENSNNVLELFHGDECLIRFHAELELLQFIEFILEQASGYPLLGILQNLQVPSLGDLKSILENFSGVKDALELSYKDVTTTLQTSLIKSLTQL